MPPRPAFRLPSGAAQGPAFLASSRLLGCLPYLTAHCLLCCGASLSPSMPYFSRRTQVPARARGQRAVSICRAVPELKALIFDCDGVILESEDLHRVAYNDAFKVRSSHEGCVVARSVLDAEPRAPPDPQKFDVRCGGKLVEWSVEFYDVLQNTVGGGKPKMRWYFSQREGAQWPTSSILGGRAPASEEEQARLIDELQDWKSERYQQMIRQGRCRPGQVTHQGRVHCS